ncbi:uncharacterized protein JCM15063_004451 [Sporobolomyces koalae]|uniref:uncharacterized protein n=1 Tax=Sporobolomyces koalae TaxID=500713 RepID=UPI003175E7FD
MPPVHRLPSTLTPSFLQLVAAPFLLPTAIRHVQAFLNPSPAGTRSTSPRIHLERTKDRPIVASFRLFVVALGVSIALFTALLPPHNLFLSLSKPHSFLSRTFPVLRYPLDIRLATETLHRAWIAQVRRDLTPFELALLQRLQTLDARLTYVAYGSTSVVNCSWCRPSSSSSTTGSVSGVSADHLLAILPGILIAYLTILCGMGLLLTDNGRERWRVWAVFAVGAGIANEVWKRLTWEGLRGVGSGQTVSMLHSRLHVQRSLLAAVFLVASYFAPTSHIPPPRPTTASIVAPAVTSLVEQSEQLLEKLRCLSIERMAILHHDDSRSKVDRFWTAASRESKLARADPTIRALLDKTAPESQQFEQFLERSFTVGPTDASHPENPSSLPEEDTS